MFETNLTQSKLNSFILKLNSFMLELYIPAGILKSGFPCGSALKESACNVGDLGSLPGLGRSPGEGKVYPLQCSGLENSMDYIIHGSTKSHT